MFNEGTIAVMRKNAAATLVIDKSGKLVESLALHPEGVEAPFRVVLILERTGRNECEPRAEIGLRGVHPYRRPHKFWLGPRQYTSRLSHEQVCELRQPLASLLELFARQRLTGRDWLPQKIKERFLYGVYISVDDSDRNLQHLFDEFELLSPFLDTRLRQLAYRIHQYPLRPRIKGYPESWDEAVVRAGLTNHLGARYLRPTVLADLAFRLGQDRSRLFLDFLDYRKMISPMLYQSELDNLYQRRTGRHRLANALHLLPRDSIHWNTFGDPRGLLVSCWRRTGPCLVYIVMPHRHNWDALEGVNNPNEVILAEKIRKERLLSGRRRGRVYEEEPIKAEKHRAGEDSYPADWDTIPSD